MEASGPIPGKYSMLSVGACEVGRIENCFYAELQPISEKFVPQALEVCKLSMSKLKQNGASPYDAMRKFADWITWTSKEKHPTFVGFNLGFDWSFVNWYFIKYLGENPFGVSGIDTKSVWFGRDLFWKHTTKTNIKRSLKLNLEHTHNALDDAREQAIIFEKILELFKKED
jgi:DNA polymerase III alpha subunit (gram-positive type)